MSDLSNKYLGYPLDDINTIKHYIKNYNHVYLFNEPLSKAGLFIYIDCTFSDSLNDCDVNYLNFDKKYVVDTNTKFKIFERYGILNNEDNTEFKIFERHSILNKEDKYVIGIDEDYIKILNNIIKSFQRNKVEFSDGTVVNQNFTKHYENIPVRYQIEITGRIQRKALSNGESKITNNIEYAVAVKVEHCTCWRLIFTNTYKNYFLAFKAGENFIKEHMIANPVYDNE